MNISEIEDAEIELLLNAIKLRYGWDFSHYKRSSLHRSIQRIVSKHNISHISDLITKIMWNEAFMELLLRDLSIPVSEMFRDPEFFKIIRKEVIPILRTYPFIKIWHAGCASGEEVYSMAMILEEEQLYNRARIYATDINQHALLKAKDGIFTSENIEEYEQNYRKSGGAGSFIDYFIAQYDSIIVKANLKKNIFFFDHNLSSDQAFGEMHLIFCRNVFIYFDHFLQKRVVKLFDESLCYGGFLCLGMKESLDLLHGPCSLYPWNKKTKIYRKGVVDLKGEHHEYITQ